MQLPSGDEPTVHQDLPKRQVTRGFSLNAQRFLELRRRDEPAFNQQFTEARFEGTHGLVVYRPPRLAPVDPWPAG